MATATENLSRIEAVERHRLVSGVSYDVELDLTNGPETYRSTTIVRFQCSRPGASTFLDLTAAAVDTLVVNGREVGSDAFDGHRVVLDDLAADNEVRLSALCRFTRTGSGLHRMVDPVDGRCYTRTHFEPFDAHRVYACFDQPDIRATFALTVTAPDDWVVISNEPPSRDAQRWSFPPTPAIPTYITVLAAGPYHSVHGDHRGLPLGLHCRQSLVDLLEADHLFDITAKGLDWFAEQFGHPYPFSKYDQVFVPDQGGAMEHAGCVTHGDWMLYRGKVTDLQRQSRAGTVYHEMAHMWFGDLVTVKWWDDLWLKESFATYFAPCAQQEAAGYESAWLAFNSGRKLAAYAADQLPTTHPIVADIPDTESLRLHYDGITYSKGAAVLAQLVAWVGRERFLAGARDYFARHAWGAATLAEFLAALEAASDRPTTAWSASWLETAGVNTLSVEVEEWEGSIVTAAVRQLPPDGGSVLRPHRLAVGCYSLADGALVRTASVELDVDGARTVVPELAGRPVPDLLLPNDGDLTFAKIKLDDRSLATLAAHLSTLGDPIARCLCWNAAWEMVRDAELPARRYAALVAAHVPAEPDLTMVSRLFGQAKSALETYGDPRHRDAGLAALSDVARKVLGDAVPGGDAQLAWARCWISVTRDADGLRGVLDGQVPIAGLDVDVDLRWDVLEALVRQGDAGADDIDAMAAHDDTNTGRRRAERLRALLPTEAAKAAAWRRVVDGSDLDLATRSSVASGIFHPGQEELVRGYVGRYVDELPRLWEAEEANVALALTRALFPSSPVDAATVAEIGRALGQPGLRSPARRVLVEGRDGLQRALRARAHDAGAV